MRRILDASVLTDKRASRAVDFATSVLGFAAAPHERIGLVDATTLFL
jgi:hypothetical protein